MAASQVHAALLACCASLFLPSYSGWPLLAHLIRGFFACRWSEVGCQTLHDRSSRGTASPGGSSSVADSSIVRLNAAKKRAKKGGRPKLPHKIAPRDGRLELNERELKSLDCLGAHQMRLEFLYLRSNFLRSFQGLGYMPNLKVVDVSSNCLESLEFLGVLPNLRELYLNANSLVSLDDLPTMPLLETLSVTQNEITSLRFMQPQPSLRAFFFSHNLVESFDGMPAFPKLDSLRCVGNPLERHEQFMLTAVIACGPTIRKINGQLISPEDHELAASFSAVTSIAIRYGAMVGDGDPQMFLFEMQKHETLASPLPLLAAAISGYPQEGASLQAEFSFVWDGVRYDNLQEGYDAATGLYFDFQWLRGDRSGYFEEIPGAVTASYVATADDVGCSLKVECTPVINVEAEDFGETVFAISNTIVASEPRALSASIEGELVEGATVTAVTSYAGGTEGASLFTWFRCPPDAAPELISSASVREYTLVKEDVDCTLRVEYTPVRDDGAIGEAILGKSGIISAAPPTVRNVRVASDAGDFVETAVLRGLGEYFGGREGISTFRWLRSEKLSTQMFRPIPGATSSEYTTSAADVDHVLKFEYTPVNAAGLAGIPSSAVTPAIQPCPPCISNLHIEPHPDGPFLEAYPLTAAVNYFGGIEGRSQITWYRRHIDDDPDDWELMYDVRSKTYTPNLVDVGYLFRVDYLPARTDGKLGKPARAFTSQPVQPCEPCIVYVAVEGEFVEGEELLATAVYLGGVEGESSCAWYRSKDEDHEVFELIEGTENQMVYVPGYNDINRVLKFKIKPAREDGVQGRPGIYTTPIIEMAEPKFIEGRITGELVERATLAVEGLYFGGEEGASEVKWYRMRGPKKLALCAKASWTYTLTADDVGFEVMVEVRPIRCDGVRGDRVTIRVHGAVAPGEPAFESLAVAGTLAQGAVLSVTGDYSGGVEGASLIRWYRVYPGMESLAKHIADGASYKVSSDDLESKLRVDYTPIREDGARGETLSYTTPVVKPAPPALASLDWFLPESEADAAEYGNPDAPVEGKSLVPVGEYSGGVEGDHVFAWYRIEDGEKGSCVAETLEYTPVNADVGKILLFEWTPVRSDGEIGETVALATRGPVHQGAPRVSDVSATVQDPSEPLSLIVGSGMYFGGAEGASAFAWLRLDAAGNETVIEDATEMAYQPTPTDFGASLVFVYTPVRSDGVAGEPVRASPVGPISAGPPRILSLTIEGEPMEGEVLHAIFTATENTDPSRVTFQWLRAGLALARGNLSTYTPTAEDVAQTLAVEAIPVDAAGVEGEPVTATTPPVQSAFPRLEELTITTEGEFAHDALFRIRGLYFGHPQGPCEKTWMRASKDAPSLWAEIPGAKLSQYKGNADDVDHHLKIVFVPVRADGVRGEPKEAFTDPVPCRADLRARIEAHVQAGEVSWDVSYKPSPASPPQPWIILANTEKIKLRERTDSGAKTRFKAPYSAQSRVVLSYDAPADFTIHLKDGASYDMTCASRELRDEIALTLRLFQAMTDGTAVRRGYC
ncbi:AIR9 protein [Thecamonas trahens ATCC 50062]|uniref:AIR9 protein n=1 Tax=Thecamonas trahens ATCC 50062 TaxID=461836 RepID=A0A0L0DKB0_THETB|nr:AIR9 protein [Thecamonas trahens ATCC 50062]KNC52722.1 AIR9 protein [Thecamonas trahens ATCC 50062]|eukprot:XP_013755036.1 AIR9 protein [Thecamonas trahens ATCC 50062]